MYCKHCGQQVNDQAVVCPHCGCSVSSSVTGIDGPSAGFSVLGFFIPLVGLILYLVWKAEYPLRAKSAGKGALIGVIVSGVVSILYAIFIGAVVGGVMTEYSYYY